MWLMRALYMFVLMCTATCIPWNEVHTLMSPEELKAIFRVESIEQVPDYEVVAIRSISKRSVDDENSEQKQLHLKAFGKQISLNLSPNANLIKDDKVKMFYADNKDGEVQYQELEEEDNPDVGVAFQDVENEAALLVNHRNTDGALFVEGTIGPNIVIHPLPESLYHLYTDSKTNSQTDIRDDFMGLDDDPPLNIRDKREAEDHIGYHIIQKQDTPIPSTDYLLMEPGNTENISSHNRQKRGAPSIIYPEVLVIVDYEGYKLHSENNRAIKKYFISFWNGVDLRYKLLKNPRVKISIAGIIISRGRDATPYLERNRVGSDAIDSAAALTDMGKYLFIERRLPTYDMAVAITKFDLCRRRMSGRCTKGTAGFAYVGGACVVNKRLEKVNSVAIVEDTGGFSGIIVAAHEVGHLLGAVHDGSPPPSYLGGPGATRCRWEDGFIMSDLRHTEKGFKWSSCSIEQFDHFLNGDTASCLYNIPEEDDSLPRVLPGKLLSLDAQCKRDRGTSACFKDERVCTQLFCFDSNSGYCVSYRPAAEGSPCGDDKYCRNGVCSAQSPDETDKFSSLPVKSTTPYNSFFHRFSTVKRSTLNDNGINSIQTTTPKSTTTRKWSWWNRTGNDVTKPSTKATTVATTSVLTSTSVSTTSTSPPVVTSVSTKNPWSWAKSKRPSTTTKNYWSSWLRRTTPDPNELNILKKSNVWSPVSSSSPSVVTQVITTERTTVNAWETEKTTRNPWLSETSSPNSAWKTSQPSSAWFNSPNSTPRTRSWTDTLNSVNPSTTVTTTSTPLTTTNTPWTNSTPNPTISHTASTTTPRTTTTTPTTTPRTTTTTPTTTPRTTTTTPTTTPRTTTTTSSILSNTVWNQPSDDCVDKIQNIAGSLTCSQFLTSYGFKYCHNKYIQKNCCKSFHEHCAYIISKS